MTKKQNNKKLALADLQEEGCVERLTEIILQKMEENEGLTLKDASGISEDAFEEVYSLAYTFYNQGKYKESIALFQFLASASPATYKYVFGLASSCHQVGAYHDAIAGFMIALEIDGDNPIPAYYITDSFLKLNCLEEAGEFAEITAFICGKEKKYAELKHRSKLISKSIKNRKI